MRGFIVDILASLINEADSVSDDLIDSMKEFLVGRDDCQVSQILQLQVHREASDSNPGSKPIPSDFHRLYRSCVGRLSRKHLTVWRVIWTVFSYQNSAKEELT